MKEQLKTDSQLRRSLRVAYCMALARSGLALALVVAGAQRSVPIFAQQSMESKATEQSKSTSSTGVNSALTEGLLDLLQEPPANAEEANETMDLKQDRKGAEDRSLDDPRVDDLLPEDVGLAGEDLSEQPSNPLQAVRQSMFTAAGYLQRGVTNQQTQQLQSDIVQRLDQLINQLDQPSNSQQTSEQQSQVTDTDQSEQQSSSQAKQQPTNQQNADQSTPPQAASQKPQADQPSSNSKQGDESSTGSSQDSPNQTGRNTSENRKQGQARVGNGPGVSGEQASGRLETNDPRQLQQDVWGQLPERVRKQMQSRMVEQFLPSYRQEIEAYFRALLEEKP